MGNKAGRWGVELLLEEARQLRVEGRYADALRVAEKGVEGARALGDIGLEIQAVIGEANTLSMLGDKAAALARLSWIIGVAADCTRRAEIERAAVVWGIAGAYQMWTTAARFLPDMPTA